MSYTKETLQFAIVRVNFKKYLQMMRSLDPNCELCTLQFVYKLFKHKPQMAVVAYFSVFWKESYL